MHFKLRQRHRGGEGVGKLPLLTSQSAVNSTAGHTRLRRETQKERVGREGRWQGVVVGGEWGERSRWRAECQPGCYSVAYLPRAYIPPGKPSSFLQYGSATSTLVFLGLAHQSVRRPLTDERSAAAGQCTASCCLSQSLTPSLHCQPLPQFWPPGSVPISSGCFFGGPVIQFSQQRNNQVMVRASPTPPRCGQSMHSAQSVTPAVLHW